MRASTSTLLPMLLICVGCRPPEAPEKYEELLGYLFEHADDEEDDALIAGIDNLSDWLKGDNLDTAKEGVSLDTIPKSAIKGLSGHNHTAKGLEGVSLVTRSEYGTKTLMESLTQYSFKNMMPDVYLTYDRDFETGQDCIVDRDCLLADGSVYSVADWGIMGEVEADRRIEYRWVEADDGWVFLQRWWLTEPSTGSVLDLKIQDQYYIGINYPKSGGTRRVHASWIQMEMSTGDASGGAANQLINNWKKDAEDLDIWIDENL